MGRLPVVSPAPELRQPNLSSQHGPLVFLRGSVSAKRRSPRSLDQLIYLSRQRSDRANTGAAEAGGGTTRDQRRVSTRLLRRVRALSASLIPGMVLTGCLLQPVASADDGKEAFRRGMAALQSKKWSEAAQKFREATAGDPTEGGEVRLYGMVFEEYLPWTRLAVALERAGDCTGALAALTQAEIHRAARRSQSLKEVAEIQRACAVYARNVPTQSAPTVRPTIESPRPTLVVEPTPTPSMERERIFSPIARNDLQATPEETPKKEPKLAWPQPLVEAPSTPGETPPIRATLTPRETPTARPTPTPSAPLVATRPTPSSRPSPPQTRPSPPPPVALPSPRVREIRVMSARGRDVVLSAGSAQGLRVGVRGRLYAPQEVSGRTVREYLAIIRVVEVTETRAVAVVLRVASGAEGRVASALFEISY